jgi:putative transposase
LYQLLEEKRKWVWTDEHTKCFQLLKDELSKNIMLTHPDLEKEFHLLVDASTVSTAAILYQEGEHGEKIIGFSGKSLKPCETRYTVTELELLSVVQALRKWRTLLTGKRVIVHTDHQALDHFKK